MGIPLFFGRLIEPFFPTAIRERGPRVTTLCIDFAGIAHQIAAHMNLHYDKWLLSQYFAFMDLFLFDLIIFLNPQKRLIICMDGIAPLGKINQQRKRRARHSLDALNREGETVQFDSNQISPGTDFSFLLDEKLRKFLDDKKHKLPPQIIYSGHQVMGEGEHKIKEYLNQIKDPTESVVIAGLDADFILLTLDMNMKIFLYRENSFVSDRKVDQLMRDNPKLSRKEAQKQSIIKKHLFLDIGELKSQLKRRDIGIYELIVATSLLGNDFIPSTPGFNLIGDLARDFLELLEGRKFGNPFDLVAFQEFLTDLKPLRDELIPKLGGKVPLLNQTDTFYLKFQTELNTDSTKEFEREWNRRLTFSDIVPSSEEVDGIEYPSKAEDIQLYAEQYILTIYWCLKYYMDHRLPNWEWVYYPNWAPTLSSLLKVEETEEFLDKMELIDEPRKLEIDLLGQLLLIMPRNLENGEPSEFIPDEVKIFQTKISPIFDFYPRDFQIIRDGVINESDGFAFLPPFDYPRFLQVISIRRISKTKASKYKAGSVFKRNLGTARSEDIEVKQTRVEISGPQPISLPEEEFHRAMSVLMGADVLKRVVSGEKERIFPNRVTIRTPKEKFNIIPVKVRPFLAASALGARDL